jgi:hypothetical protein
MHWLTLAIGAAFVYILLFRRFFLFLNQRLLCKII